MILSKSDYKIATSCCKKLVYKKASYPTMNDGNEYMEMLAQGGYIVSKYAQLLYPMGIEVKGNSIEEAIHITKTLLKDNEYITLFEATFLSDGKVIRTDILEKKKDVLHIIEVKSKSYDSDDEDNPKKKFEEYIEDVAYQILTVKEACPDYEIHPYLLLPDKAKRTTIDGLAGWFTITKMEDERFEIEELPAQGAIKFQKPLIEFKYENSIDKGKYIDLLQNDNLLTLMPVDKEVNEMMNTVVSKANLYLNILENGIQPKDYSINKNCKTCEFNIGDEMGKNGYRECWKELTDISPHIFDLYFGGAIGSPSKGFYLNELINNKKVSFFNLDIERFKNSKGEYGSRGERQLLQFENTKINSEWISSEMKNALSRLKYPLHFIDFETYTGAIPYHKGMRPYEFIAFQWSCHTIQKPGDAPQHSEFINREYNFPNFRFAEQLMQAIGTTGTPVMWSSFENTILRTILEQMDVYNYQNDTLREWLTGITTDKKQNRTGRFVDMNELTLKYYFHPYMKGKTSIKKVLPAIWNNNPYLHAIPWFEQYVPADETTLNPYDTLAPIIGELEKEEVVKDGTGAMRAYNEIMFGSANNPERREQLIQLLLQYCELDTMAMVIIWKYWMDKSGL